MPGHRSLLPALVAAATLSATLAGTLPGTLDGVLGTAPAAAAAAGSAEESDPLQVSIDSLNPSVIPEKGTVTLTGTVTNVSDETWEGVNLYPVLPTDGLPITTVSELDAAAQVPADLVIGERELSVTDQVGDLAPGAVAPYALRIPRRLLPTSEGVHWLGVHALGATAEGRDGFNDGKARTFIPLVRNAKPVPTALVLQLRSRVLTAPDGRIDRPDLWASSLATGGRLRSVVEMGAAAGSHDLTWLVDPAVISAVNALVAGNPTRLPPRADPPPEESPTPGPDDAGEGESPTATAEALTPPSTDQALSDPGDPAVLAAVAAEGQAWLARLQTALAGQEVLALPYGDVDASAASHLDSLALIDAQTLAATVLAGLGQTSAPVLASPSGYLRPDAVTNASPDTTVLVTSEAVGVEAPTVADVGGRKVVLSSATAVDGGPGPDDRLATVALRQRVLAEAAVRALDEGREPLVVTLPTDWSTADPAGFFSGLDVDFVDLTSLSDVASNPAEPVDELAYPAFQQDFELDAANFAAADDLIDAGSTLQQILPDNPDLAGHVEREAYAGVSYWQRPRLNEARATAVRSRAWIQAMMARVTIDGPVSVTLSSDSGQFPASLRNGLDEPVVVRVAAESSNGLSVELPDEIALDPGETARLRLSATTDRVGSHTVRLYVATSDGTPTGSDAELPIRSNQVSQIIWIVIVAGGALLFGAIALRLVRRLRRPRPASG